MPARPPAPPAGYAARPATPADAAEVAALLRAYELAHQGEARSSVDGVGSDWAGADLEANTVLVRDGMGAVVALCDMVPSRSELLLTYAHVAPGAPDWARLTDFLAEAAEARAAALSGGAAVVVRNYLPAEDCALAARLEARGYEGVRTIHRLGAELAAEPPAPAWPEGVSVRAYRGAADEPAVYEAFELGSSGMWGRPGNTFEQWSRHVRGRQPGGMRLALAGGRVVGIGVTWVPSAGAGVVESLRVVPEWRRRGLGAALLADAFGLCHAHGARSVTLTVDASSSTGAPELYLRAGMRLLQSYLVYEKRV